MKLFSKENQKYLNSLHFYSALTFPKDELCAQTRSVSPRAYVQGYYICTKQQQKALNKIRRCPVKLFSKENQTFSSSLNFYSKITFPRTELFESQTRCVSAKALFSRVLFLGKRQKIAVNNICRFPMQLFSNEQTYLNSLHFYSKITFPLFQRPSFLSHMR